MDPGGVFVERPQGYLTACLRQHPSWLTSTGRFPSLAEQELLSAFVWSVLASWMRCYERRLHFVYTVLHHACTFLTAFFWLLSLWLLSFAVSLQTVPSTRDAVSSMVCDGCIRTRIPRDIFNLAWPIRIEEQEAKTNLYKLYFSR